MPPEDTVGVQSRPDELGSLGSSDTGFGALLSSVPSDSSGGFPSV